MPDGPDPDSVADSKCIKNIDRAAVSDSSIC